MSYLLTIQNSHINRHKTKGMFHLVQEFYSNAAVVPLHHVVSNLYIILPIFPANTTHDSLLCIKDIFISVPLGILSEDLLTFTLILSNLNN